MIRKATIVVLTSASLWTLFCWGISYAPKAGGTWFAIGSSARGWTMDWHVYEGRSYVVSRTFDDLAPGIHQRSYRPPPVWVFLLGLAAYPSAVFVRGPLRRWDRRRSGLCVHCGAAIDPSDRVCTACGGPVGGLLRLTVARWFTFAALHAAIGLLAASGAVVVGQYGVALVVVLLAIAAPLFGFAWVVLYTRLLNRRYHRQGYCTKCRYDLTGNVSGTCPECGTPIGLEPTIETGDSPVG